jgi:hypothetical protein
LYPDSQLNFLFYGSARRWYQAEVAMGGNATTGQYPDFQHSSFDFTKMQPVDNGEWVQASVGCYQRLELAPKCPCLQPEAAAGVAFLQYMAAQVRIFVVLVYNIR